MVQTIDPSKLTAAGSGLFGCGRRTRTSVFRVMSPVVYQLTYPAIDYYLYKTLLCQDCGNTVIDFDFSADI